MKAIAKLFVLVIMAMAIMTGCKKPPSPTPIPTVPPGLTIVSQSNLKLGSIDLKINIVTNGSNIAAVGICYGTAKYPTTANSKTAASTLTGTTTVSITGLQPNTKYYVRVYAVTKDGNSYYSKEKRIWTYGLMDVDGNGYHTVKIGPKIFTVENLKVTHYRNGDKIANITANMAWHNATIGAYCYYDNDSAKYDSIYGALYNFYAVKDPRGLAPKGWHIPSFDEWIAVAKALGSSVSMGGSFKETGTKHWKAPNTGATNTTGFTALPAGDRGDNVDGSLGTFGDLGTGTLFWTTTLFSDGKSALTTAFQYNWTYIAIGGAYLYDSGFSVRLVKN